MKTSAPNTVSQAEFARAEGVSRQRVSQWRGMGMPCTDAGRVKVVEARRWLASTVDRAGSVSERDVLSRQGNGDDEGAAEATDLTEARRRKLVADETFVRLQIAEKNGSLVDREEVRRALSAFARLQSTKWQNFATRYGQEMAAEIGCDPKALMAVLDRYVRVQLDEIANTKPTLPGATA